MIFESFCEADTFELGVKIGREAKPGDVYTLIGDLGVGKTAFTKGVAIGLEITEPISSPTFTIVQVYDEGRIPFYHFDVWTKSVMKIIFMGMELLLLSGLT